MRQRYIQIRCGSNELNGGGNRVNNVPGDNFSATNPSNID
jgi:hypothetical protein